MICHICRQEASGQCKNCLRYYCPDHGNILCQDCGGLREGEPRQRPQAPEPPVPDISLPPQPGYTGPKCYACGNPAERACGQCGHFYCETHGPFLWGNVCQSCNTFGCIVSVVILVVIGIGYVVFVAGR